MTTRDNETTIQDLKDITVKFRDERSWKQFHSPKNLSMSIAIEAAELMEHYQWDRFSSEIDGAVADELADIFINILMFADICNIDLASCTQSKLARAAKKYPATLFHDDQQDPADFARIKQAYRDKKSENDS